MKRACLLLAFFALAVLVSSDAQAIFIDNGVSGAGRWEVDAQAGGESRIGYLTTSAYGTDNVLYDYYHYIDVGANGGAFRIGSTATSGPSLTGGGHVVSAGSFTGQNGTINWTSDSRIKAGDVLYLTTLEFSSTDPFGTTRLIQYLDEDVFSISFNNLVVLGTPGADDFQLLTIHSSYDAGVSHAATYNTATGMTYIGWAADEYWDLQQRITGSGQSYSIAGVVDTGSLSPMTDSRYPTDPAYGPEDITSAIAFDLDPSATFASVILSLGGAPEGQPPPPPPPPPPDVIPEPGSVVVWGLLSLSCLGVVWCRRRRRNA
jgi:hypothetical protein